MSKEIGFASFGRPFQERLAQLILDDAAFANQVGEVLNFQFFELKYLQLFSKLVYNFKDKYGKYPSRPSIEAVLRTEIGDENESVQKQVREFYARVVSDKVRKVDEEYVKDKSLDFCRKQKLREAFVKSVDLMESSSFDEISTLLNSALKLGSDNNLGYKFIEQFEQRYENKTRNPISTGWDIMDRYIQKGLGSGELGVVIAPTGCHAKGTEIMMSDGAIKKVEDVQVGESLMGPDSRPRLVEQLCRGREKMYRVVPTKGESFVVNENHVLSLKRTNDGTSKAKSVVNISIGDYFSKSEIFKHTHKLYRAGVQFEEKSLLVPPYIMGLILGDGLACNGNISFTSADSELISWMHDYCVFNDLNLKIYPKEDSKAFNCNLTFKSGIKNPLMEKLEYYNLREKRSGDKFVPEAYKVASRTQRLEMLAGLIDTDGSLSSGGYDFISKSNQLAKDVAYLARSVGLAAYMSECQKGIKDRNFVGTYFRVSISGDCSLVPCRLERKQASKRKQTKDVLVTGFSIEELSEDDFYGFSLSGDHLYLMGDFTVTHNSGKSMILVHLGAAAVKAGKTVVHYTLELSDETIGLRYDACITGIGLDALKALKSEVYEEIKDVPGKLIIREYPTKSATTETIKNHLERLKQRGVEIDMVIVDYGDLLRPCRHSKEKRNDLETIYEELRGIAQIYKCPLWTASQTNRCFWVDTKLLISRDGKSQIMKIGDVVKGDLVETHKGFRKITKAFPKEVQPTYKITLKSGKTIICSKRHQFPVASGKLLSISEGLSVSDKLLTKKVKNES